MIIKKLIKREGYLFAADEHDTLNIICHRGHVYEDGDRLVASLDWATREESRQLRRLGEVVADGDFGELSVAFEPSRWREVARIMRPRRAKYGNVA